MKFTISCPPVTKKNHQQIRKRRDGTPFIAQGDTYREAESAILWLIPRHLRQKIDYPVNLCVHYYVKRNARVDKTNLESAICDILVKAGVLADDSALKPAIVVSTDGSRVYVDRENPRYEIEITKVEVFQ